AHVPAEQTSSVLHALPHAPQLTVSLASETHTPPHEVCGATHPPPSPGVASASGPWAESIGVSADTSAVASGIDESCGPGPPEVSPVAQASSDASPPTSAVAITSVCARPEAFGTARRTYNQSCLFVDRRREVAATGPSDALRHRDAVNHAECADLRKNDG